MWSTDEQWLRAAPFHEGQNMPVSQHHIYLLHLHHQADQRSHQLLLNIYLFIIRQLHHYACFVTQMILLVSLLISILHSCFFFTLIHAFLKKANNTTIELHLKYWCTYTCPKFWDQYTKLSFIKKLRLLLPLAFISILLTSQFYIVWNILAKG